MIVAVDMQRLRKLDRVAFDRACRDLMLQWREKGCPEPDDMPRVMLATWAALKVEGERRGHQMTLF